MNPKVIDGLSTHLVRREQQPTWMLKVRDDYFWAPKSMFAPVDLHQLLDEMDAHGVQKAILMDNIAATRHRAQLRQARPDRFALAMGGLNLLRADARAARAHCRRRLTCRWVYAAVGTELLGRRPVPAERCRLLPAVHRRARSAYRVCLNTGLPDPRSPVRWCRNPIHPDRVCVRFPSCGCA